MSNESTSETMSDKGGIGQNDPKRTTEAPKSGQQSQGDSRADDDGMKHAGSTNFTKDPKKAKESGTKGASSR
jgi:general stress protein YciG